MQIRVTEKLESQIALNEVLEMRVEHLHKQPGTCTLRCESIRGYQQVTFTTDRDIHDSEQGHGPRAYTSKAAPGATWAEFLEENGLALRRVEVHGEWEEHTDAA